MDLQWEALVTTLAGGGVCATLFRYFIMKALKDIEKVAHQLHKISVKLSIFEVKVAQLERLEEKTTAQAHKIADIESRLKYERANRLNSFDQGGM